MSIIDKAWLDAHPGARTHKGPKPRGYADQPGTGPAGEICGSCKHHVKKHMAKVYHKCALMEHFWTGGAVTDIRVRSAACRHWQPGEAQHFMPPR